MTSSFFGRILEREQTRLARGAAELFDALAARGQEPAPGEMILAASELRQSVTALLRRCADWLTPEELIRLQLSLHAALDRQIEVAVQNLFERRVQALTDLAERDPLTGLSNRAAFTRRLAEEVSRARRYSRELSVALFDVDDFKSVNDRFGHPAGDQVLAGVAHILQASLRGSDAVFRYGGDEFIALCPETSGVAMENILRRVERNLRAHCAESESAQEIGISWGFACFPADADDAGGLIRIADQRLYACKKEHHLHTTASL